MVVVVVGGGVGGDYPLTPSRKNPYDTNNAWTLSPACCHKAIVVIRRMGVLGFLHGFTIFYVPSMLCAIN